MWSLFIPRATAPCFESWDAYPDGFDLCLRNVAVSDLVLSHHEIIHTCDQESNVYPSKISQTRNEEQENEFNQF